MTSIAPLALALVDTEPAVGASLMRLLAQYQEFLVYAWSGDDVSELPMIPDIVLVTPQRPERLTELRRRCPHTYILARVPWDRDGYWNHPALDEPLDKLAPFETVLEALLRIRRERFNADQS